MKRPAVRIEVIKGDAARKIPWVRMVRVIERDRTQVLSKEEFETAGDFIGTPINLPESSPAEK